MRMERDSIPRINAQARARGMSYGQYVGAVYYPVVIVEELPDGGRIERSAAVPEIVRAVEPMAQIEKPAKKPVSVKPGRKCVICGNELGRFQRKYCSDDCSRKAAKVQYDAKGRKPYVSTAIREDRPCAMCGKMMIQVTQQKRYCSAACNAARSVELNRAFRERHRSTPKLRICQVCGRGIDGTGIKYCSACAAEERRRRWRENHARRKTERKIANEQG